MRVIEVPAPSLSVLPQARPAANTEVWTIKLKTITPMFGGGATVREVDSQVPIRGASVRGHLRFWWRATAGAGCAGAEDLFKKEEAIWGSAREPGKVGLRVTVEHVGAKEPCGEIRLPQSIFLFPFAEQTKDRLPAAVGRKDVKFTLRLTVPDAVREDVRRAVRAWIMFGGVGARTRRGLGALMVLENPADWLPRGVEEELLPYLRELAGHGQVPGNADFSRLKGGVACFGDPDRDTLVAWSHLGVFWSRFRKGHYTPVRPRYDPRKRAAWPDYVNLQPSSLRPRDNEVTLCKPYLGLPIIYKWPAALETTIEAAASGRMASPIILKSVAFADGSVRPMIALLKAPAPKEVKVGERVLKLRMPNAADPVLRALGASDPLDAVIKAAKKSDYQVIGPL